MDECSRALKQETDMISRVLSAFEEEIRRFNMRPNDVCRCSEPSRHPSGGIVHAENCVIMRFKGALCDVVDDIRKRQKESAQ